MRLRNIRGAGDIIAKSPYVILNPEEKKGAWNTVFENNNPIYIEIGMGKGQFLIENAIQNPAINYIGIERYSSVLLRAVQKVADYDLPNLRFLCFDAAQITDIFVPQEVNQIFLNFSDPWPKDRHAKRRLTSHQFLARYAQILKKDGVIEFKTDNRLLFDFSMEEVPVAGWELVSFTYDLHNDPIMNKNNIMTEYEEKFSSMGYPIHKYIIRQK